MKFFGVDGALGPGSDEITTLLSKFVADSPIFKSQVEEAFSKAVEKAIAVTTKSEKKTEKQLRSQNELFEARIQSQELKSAFFAIVESHIEGLEKGTLFETHRDQISAELDKAFSDRVTKVKSEIAKLVTELETRQASEAAALREKWDRLASEIRADLSKSLIQHTNKLKETADQYSSDTEKELEQRFSTARSSILAELELTQVAIHKDIERLQAEAMDRAEREVRHFVLRMSSYLKEDIERHIQNIMSGQQQPKFISNRNLAKILGTSVREAKRRRRNS